MYVKLDVIDRYICELFYDENGKRKMKRSPGKIHVFEKSENGKYKDLFGHRYKRKDLSTRSFNKRKNEIGVIHPVYQYIFEKYPNRENFPKVNIGFFDIEVDSRDGFPNVREPKNDIQSICLIYENETYILGIKKIDENSEYIKEIKNLNYIYCETQFELILKFFEIIHKKNIDILTGWNSNEFDLAYIINYFKKICLDKGFQENELLYIFSPFYKFEDFQKEELVYTYKNSYRIKGLTTIDFLELYKKFQTSSRESFKLDFIGEYELGKGKEKFDDYADLNELFEKNYNLFTLYNYRDVEIVQNLEEKLGLLQLTISLSYLSGINFEDIFSPVRTWDTILYNMLMKDNIIVKEQPEFKDKKDYPGAFVFEPQIGLSNWVVSFDVTSMYPSLIRTFNMSYETLLEENDSGYNDLAGICYSGEVSKSSCYHFKKDYEGIFPKILKKVMQERKDWKKKMFEKENLLNEIENEIKRKN